MERFLTIFIQFQVSSLKVRRIQQSSQFEPCAWCSLPPKWGNSVEECQTWYWSVFRLSLSVLKTNLLKWAWKVAQKLKKKMHKICTAPPGAFGSNWWTKINYMIKIERIVLFIFQLWAMAMWARLKSNSITFQTLCSASQSCKYFQSSLVQATLKCL